jgi:hypothetical protein
MLASALLLAASLVAASVGARLAAGCSSVAEAS